MRFVYDYCAVVVARETLQTASAHEGLHAAASDVVKTAESGFVGFFDGGLQPAGTEDFVGSLTNQLVSVGENEDALALRKRRCDVREYDSFSAAGGEDKQSPFEFVPSLEHARDRLLLIRAKPHKVFLFHVHDFKVDNAYANGA